MNKKRIFEILGDESDNDLVSKYFNIFILILIVLNVSMVILGTVESLSNRYSSFFYNFELFSVVIFSIEYILRIWSCTILEKYQHPVYGRIKFIFSPLSLIDLFAILPFYLPLIVNLDLRGLRVLRLFRMFRLFKMGRYLESLQIIGYVFKSKKEQIILTGITIFLLLLFSSSLLYVVENEAQPEKFSSIPQSMWWGTAALTTVGYGDSYPITPIGRILGSIIAIMGIGIFAMPAGILASGFSESIKKVDKLKKIKTLEKAIEIANNLNQIDNQKLKDDIYQLLETMVEIDGKVDENESNLLSKVKVIFSEQKDV